jgi:hypothetical protein
MGKIIVDQIESSNNSNITLSGNTIISGNLKIKPLYAPTYTIMYGATAPSSLNVPSFGYPKARGVNSYEFGINFGSTGANPPTDWSSLTGWVIDPYNGNAPGSGISASFRDAIAQFKPDYSLYPKGGMSLYWDWVSNDFVSASQYTSSAGTTLLPNDYNVNSVDYKQVKPAAHIDNFAAWLSELESQGAGDKMYIYANLYLTTGENTSNPNLGTGSVKNQALNYINRQNPLNVTYIEMGHEYYLQGSEAPDIASNNGGYARRFPSGSNYAAKYLQYLQEIRSEPQLDNIYCAANLCTEIGGDPNDPQVNRRNNWNETFINEYFTNPIYTADTSSHKLDAISIHGFLRVSSTSNAYQTFETWILDAADRHYQKIRLEMDNCLNLIGSIDLTIPKPKFWAIGYNLNDDQFSAVGNSGSAISGCWGHGLFNLVYQFRLMSDPDISLTAFHSTHGGRAYGLVYSVVNGFGGGTTTPYDLTATGYIFKILREAEESTNSMRALSIAGANSPTTQALGVYGMIFNRELNYTGPNGSIIVYPSNTKTSSILLVNLSDTQRVLDLSDILNPLDYIISYKSAKAPLETEINKIVNGVKILPTEVFVTNPSTSLFFSYPLDPYEVLHITIGVSNDLAIE